jgi:hypothetical protein
MYSKQKSKLSQIENQRELLIKGKSDISLNNFLMSERCQDIISGCREFRDRVYTPIKTTLTFIKQVLHDDKSCKNAVAGVVAERLQHFPVN